MQLQDLIGKVIKISLYAYLLYVIFWKSAERPSNYSLGVKDQTLITKPGKLLTDKGILQTSGFSKNYIVEINSENVYPVMFGFDWFKYSRVKMYEHYWFNSEQKIVNIIMSNLRYAGSVNFVIYDLETKQIFNKELVLLPYLDSDQFPKMDFNAYKCQGSYSTTKGGDTVTVRTEKKEGDICDTIINVDFKEIKGEFIVTRDINQEDAYDMSPIDEEQKYWLYDLKSGANKCSFNYKLNGEEYKSNNKALGFADIGRGIFFYKTHSRWASMMGYLKDNTTSFTLNFGNGITDPKTSKSSNYFFKVNGKLFKLNPIAIKYDPLNFMNSMSFSTHENFMEEKNNSAEFVFTSYHHLPKKENFLIVSSDFNLVYGTFSGWVTDDEGNKYEFEDVAGFYEEFNMKW